MPFDAEPKIVGGSSHYAMGVFNPCLVGARGIVDPSLQGRDEPSFFVPPFALQVAVPEDEETDPNPAFRAIQRAVTGPA